MAGWSGGIVVGAKAEAPAAVAGWGAGQDDTNVRAVAKRPGRALQLQHTMVSMLTLLALGGLVGYRHSWRVDNASEKFRWGFDDRVLWEQ